MKLAVWILMVRRSCYNIIRDSNTEILNISFNASVNLAFNAILRCTGKIIIDDSDLVWHHFRSSPCYNPPYTCFPFRDSSLVDTHVYQSESHNNPIYTIRHYRSNGGWILPSQNSVEDPPAPVRCVFRITTIDVPKIVSFTSIQVRLIPHW